MFDWLIHFWQWFVPIYLRFHLILFRVLVPIALVLWLGSMFLNWLGQQFKPCPSCKKVVPKKWEACRYCGHAFVASAATAGGTK